MDKDTIAVYDAQVDGYADMIHAMPKDTNLLAFLQTVRPRGQILDLGCGPGASSAIIRDHRFTVDPVDASVEMVRYANETFDINARVAQFSDITEQSVYDGIWASFSLLHAPRIEFNSILLSLHAALTPTGVLGLSMKVGSGEKRDRLGRFYTYYTEPELVDRLAASGFAVINTVPGEGKGLAGTVDPWVCIIATR